MAIKVSIIHYTLQPCHFLILRYSFHDMQIKIVKRTLEQMIYLYSRRNYWQLVIPHDCLNRVMDVKRDL